MPTFSADYLVRLAGASGFRSDTLEKVLRLGRVLDQIARHSFLGDRLALKGGTALNLFFGARAPRLSVDLDFNYVRPVERDEMLREKEDIERTLGLVAGGDGYRLQWGAQEHAGRKTYLLYDAVGLAQGRWSHDHARLRRLFVILSAGLDRPLPTYEIPHRASLSQAEVAEALAPVLRGEERPRREALTAALAPVITGLATLSDPEREYVERIQWGDFRPELVVQEPDLLERVRRHPMLLWKAENGRKRRRPGQGGGQTGGAGGRRR